MTNEYRPARVRQDRGFLADDPRWPDPRKFDDAAGKRRRRTIELKEGDRERHRRNTGVYSPTVLSVSDSSMSQRCTQACARKRSEEHTSELQALMRISSAVFCLKK